jgi:transposase
MGLNIIAKSKEALVEDRRARVASCKVQGMSIRKTIEVLAKAKCVNPDTGKPWSVGIIKSDVDHLTARWKEEALKDISQAKADELAKLDEAEREAWAAWHRGIGRKQVRTTKTGGKEGGEISLRTEVLNGDPRYLGIILDCQARRAKMLGLDAPQRLEASGPQGGPIPIQGEVDLTKLNDAELSQLAALVAKAGVEMEAGESKP